MTQNEERISENRRGRRTGLVTMAALVLLVFAAVPFVGRLRADREMDAEIAAIRASNAPVTLQEWAVAYDPAAIAPDKEWVGYLLETARDLAEVDRLGDLLDERPWEDNGLEDHLDEIAVCVAAKADLIETLSNHAESGFAPAPADLGLGAGLGVDHVRQHDRAIGLLSLAALSALEAGDPPGAMALLEDAKAVLAPMREEPSTSALAGLLSGRATVLNALRWCLARGGLGEAELLRAQGLLAFEDLRPLLGRALAYERSIALESYARVDHTSRWRGPGSLSAPVIMFTTSRLTGGFERDQVRMLRAYRQKIAATKKSYPELIETFQAIHVDADETEPSLLGALVDIAAVSYETSRWGVFRHEALRRCALVAVAVELFQLRTGESPARLKQLVPEYLEAIPEDPMNAAPLRYRPMKEYYRVYSVGGNGVDDGGDTHASVSSDWIYQVLY